MKRLLSLLSVLALLLGLTVTAWADGNSSDETQDFQKAYYNSD